MGKKPLKTNLTTWPLRRVRGLRWGWAENVVNSRVIRRKWFEKFSVDNAERHDPSRPHAKQRLTKDRKQLFLTELARTGVIAEAARIASPNSKAGAVSTFRTERTRDAEFAAAWDEALDHATGIIEREVFRRAVEGWDEPTRFGPVRKHSDRLLELLAKAKSPQYRERRHYEVEARTEKKLDLSSLPPHKLALLKELLDESPCPDLGGLQPTDATPTTTEPSGDRAPGSLTEDLRTPPRHRISCKRRKPI